MPFGQLVIGPPGCGKSTYCKGMHHYLTLAGRRAAIVNLDPANEQPPYEAAVDIGDLVSLSEVMAAHGLGPNGGLIFCMEFLAANLDWLASALAPLAADGSYVLFDLPGQCELFTMHPALRVVVDALTSGKGMGGGKEGGAAAAATTTTGAPPPPPQLFPAWRLVAVHLLDAVLCTDPAKYLAGCLDALGAMLHLELPHINILSKVDQLKRYGPCAFDLAWFARAADLEALSPAIASARGGAWAARHARLTSSLAECISDFALLRFHPCAVEDEGTVGWCAAAADRAAGWVPHAGAALPGEHADRDGALPPGVGQGDEDAFLEAVAAKYGVPPVDGGDDDVMVGGEDGG